MLLNESPVSPKKWVDFHADYLYTYAITRINDEELARDLVQETFLAALEALSGFEGKSTERTWLTAILKHKIVDTYRKRSRQGIQVPLDTLEGQVEYFDPELNNWKTEHWPEPLGIEDQDPLHHKELNQILQECMKKLPSLWSTIFTMKHMDDSSKNDICNELKLSESNFWVIIHRAKVSLRSCLQKRWLKEH